MPFSKETHILVVDDDEDDYFLTRDFLMDINGKIHVYWASTFAEGIKQVKDRQHHLYLVDYRLGARTGLDFIKEALELDCEEPIILLTGKGNPAIDREAMTIGAADYLIKSEISTEKLERSIRYSLSHAASVKALKANERKYRSIFERSKDSVFIADLSLHLKDVNNATSELLALPIEELKGQCLYPFIRDGGTNVSGKLTALKDVEDMEIVLISKNGDEKFCILSASIQKDGNEEPYIQGIIHDITSLKKAEKASLQAEKLAAAGRFIRTLAHEVRNPLNNIHMAIEQLLDQSWDEENTMFLQIIQRNSKRINDLITELLDSSRPTEMISKRVSLQEILDKSISAALDRITLQRINMNVSFPNEPCYIRGDENKLKISFLNIIINAVEAMSGVQGELNIRIIDMQPYYVVEISDNGCGISAENISHLFEPYFTSKRNGMGLGLASTLNILQAHAATIDVVSKENTGTTFSITLTADQKSA